MSFEPHFRQLDTGVEPLVGLLDLMTNLRAVFLDANDDRRGWSRPVKHHSNHARKVDTATAMFHPGLQVLFYPDPDVRRSHADHRATAYRELAGALGRE